MIRYCQTSNSIVVAGDNSHERYCGEMPQLTTHQSPEYESNFFRHRFNTSFSFPLCVPSASSPTHTTRPASNQNYVQSQPDQRISMELERVISSPTVQRHMPDLLGLYTTDGFKEQFENWHVSDDPQIVKKLICNFAEDLDRHERCADIWKHQVGSWRMIQAMGFR
jgi:hypothetical protein